MLTFIKYLLCGHIVAPIEIEVRVAEPEPKTAVRYIEVPGLRCDSCLEEIAFWKAPSKSN
ncbi:hypothetical protein TWF696_008067 [Orbilia brochopaga]|uniref:HMA domain-containing protein n=1 Tax=Orbilia brochopaga TaxID=3140254 RepID=A0AAV9UPF2_9PEZI